MDHVREPWELAWENRYPNCAATAAREVEVGSAKLDRTADDMRGAFESGWLACAEAVRVAAGIQEADPHA